MLESFSSGGVISAVRTYYSMQAYIDFEEGFIPVYPSSNNVSSRISFYNVTNNTLKLRLYTVGQAMEELSVSPDSIGDFGYTFYKPNYDFFYYDGHGFTHVSQCMQYLKANNISVSPKSPDVCGDDGQLDASKDTTQNTQPYVINFTPNYNVNNYNVNPIPSLQDFSGVVNTLEQNVADNISNEDIIRPFINPYLVPRTVIDNPVDPDPEPTTAPNPIIPTPSIIPPQPTAAPLPTLAPEDETEIPKYMNQPDLTSKFPFCIPFDLALIFALFSSDIRQAPVFDWELNFGPAGTYNIHIDFSPYDPAAALFRLLMLIFFVFSLALGTHRLIHPEGP